jgi:hypothetical protein
MRQAPAALLACSSTPTALSIITLLIALLQATHCSHQPASTATNSPLFIAQQQRNPHHILEHEYEALWVKLPACTFPRSLLVLV